MKILLHLLLITLLFKGPCQAQQKGFVIVGKLLNADTLQRANLLRYDSGEVDTVAIKNGQFVFSGKVHYPTVALVGADKIRPGLGLWLSNDTIRVSFKVINHGGKLQLLQPQEVIGPPESVDYLAHIQLFNSIRTSKASKQQKSQQIAEVIRAYVQDHTNSYYSALLLSMNLQDLGGGTAKELFTHLSPEIRGSESGQSIAKQILNQETNALGKVIDRVSLPDQQGVLQPVSTAGKPYTLLCFWASWCGPCRSHNRDLVKLSRRVQNQCQMVSISLDTDKQAWLKAIEKDQLTWLQLSDLQGWESPVSKLFAIHSVPYYVLVNQGNEIVATNLGDAQKLLDAK